MAGHFFHVNCVCSERDRRSEGEEVRGPPDLRPAHEAGL